MIIIKSTSMWNRYDKSQTMKKRYALKLIFH